MTDSDGVMDVDGRWMTWTSAQLGFDMLRTIAGDWGHPSMMWTALNALGVLQGIWQAGGNEPPLSALLDPEHIRDHAVAAHRHELHRRWLDGVIDNYEDRMGTLEPGAATADVVPQLADLRNLVHGVEGRPKRRTDRLRTLEVLGRSDVNMMLLADVATAWWGAAVLDPEALLRTGRPPWPS